MVIAIISLLISILAPSLNLAKDIAKQVACASNMNATGRGVHLYCQENDDRYPPYRMAFKSGAPYVNGWYVRLEAMMHVGKVGDLDLVTLKQHFRGAGIMYEYRYIENPRSFYCPAQTYNWFVYDEYIYNRRVQPNVLMPWGSWDNWSNMIRSGYFFNTWGKKYGTQWDNAFRTLSSMDNDKALIIDQPVFPWATAVHTAQGPERPTFNITYSDGHVESHANSLIQDILLVNWGGVLGVWADNSGPNNDWADVWPIFQRGV